MIMMLESGEVCSLSNNCPYNEPYGRCQGSLSTRRNQFECKYVVNGKLITDGMGHNPLDQTGKMKVIME